MSGDNLPKVLNQLKGIEGTQIGFIELSEKLDIDVVTDIFIRINSKGTPLSQGDFVMSKMPFVETRFIASHDTQIPQHNKTPRT